MQLQHYSISYSLLCVTQVSAWTQSQRFGHRLMNTMLRVSDEDQVDMERSRLERLFTDFKDDFHDNILPLNRNMDRMENLNLPVNGWLESTNDDVYSDWYDASPCYGEECDVSENLIYHFERPTV